MWTAFDQIAFPVTGIFVAYLLHWQACNTFFFRNTSLALYFLVILSSETISLTRYAVSWKFFCKVALQMTESLTCLEHVMLDIKWNERKSTFSILPHTWLEHFIFRHSRYLLFCVYVAARRALEIGSGNTQYHKHSSYRLVHLINRAVVTKISFLKCSRTVACLHHKLITPHLILWCRQQPLYRM